MNRLSIFLTSALTGIFFLAASPAQSSDTINIEITENKSASLQIKEYYHVNSNDCTASRDSHVSGDFVDSYHTLHIYDYLNEYYINAISDWREANGTSFTRVPFHNLSDKQKDRIKKIKNHMPEHCQ